MSSDDFTVSGLRQVRDEQLVKGHFSTAQGTQEKINEMIGEEDETAALSAGRDRRLHAEIEDLDELKERRDDAEEYGFAALAAEYDERIDELQESEKTEAALEAETRAALAEPDDAILDRTEAALGADDVVKAAERGQAPTQYVYDAYGRDPREFGEYELRRELREAEPKRLPKQHDEASKERAALGISDRADLDAGGQTPAGLIRERYGLDPEDFSDAEELRDAIVAQGGYKSGVTNTSDSTFSALSANRKNGSDSDS